VRPRVFLLDFGLVGGWQMSKVKKVTVIRCFVANIFQELCASTQTQVDREFSRPAAKPATAPVTCGTPVGTRSPSGGFTFTRSAYATTVALKACTKRAHLLAVRPMFPGRYVLAAVTFSVMGHRSNVIWYDFI